METNLIAGGNTAENSLGAREASRLHGIAILDGGPEGRNVHRRGHLPEKLLEIDASLYVFEYQGEHIVDRHHGEGGIAIGVKAGAGLVGADVSHDRGLWTGALNFIMSTLHERQVVVNQVDGVGQQVTHSRKALGDGLLAARQVDDQGVPGDAADAAREGSELGLVQGCLGDDHGQVGAVPVHQGFGGLGSDISWPEARSSRREDHPEVGADPAAQSLLDDGRLVGSNVAVYLGIAEGFIDQAHQLGTTEILGRILVASVAN